MDPKTLEILQSIKDDIGEIKVSQKGVERDLVHMRERSNAVEKSVENVRLEIDPIKKHVQGLQFLAKIAAILALLLSITLTALNLSDKLTSKDPTHERMSKVRIQPL